MSLRLRRLANEARLLQEQFGGHTHITVLPAGGDPPDRYRVTYRVAGLERRPDGALVVRREHEMEIVLPAEYPRQPASCRMLTPVFHPNIDVFTVCTSDFHAAQETLSDLIVRVGQMIAFQKHNVKSPLNAEAAHWCEQNLARLPVDPADLHPKSEDLNASRPTVSAPPCLPVVPSESRGQAGTALGEAPPAPPPPPATELPVVVQHGSRAETSSTFMPRPEGGSTAGRTTDEVDEFSVAVLRTTSMAPSEDLIRVPVGTPFRLEGMTLMLSFRLNPSRIELVDLVGARAIEVPMVDGAIVATGALRVLIRGIPSSSLATEVGGRPKSGSSGNSNMIFWNGIAATQVSLAERTLSLLETSAPGQLGFERTLSFGRSKVRHLESLLGTSQASLSWNSRIGLARDRLIRALEVHGMAIDGK